MGAENQLAPSQELSEENATPYLGQTAPAKGPRRWLQYSLGASLLVVLLAAMVFGVMVESKRRAYLRRIDDAIEKTNAGENSRHASACYRELFALVGEGGLARLQASEADSIAVQAAWEEVRLTVPESPAARVDRPENEKLSWFVQFLESRLSTKTPTWWAEVVQDARWYGRDNVRPGDPTQSPYHISGLPYVGSPREISLTAESGVISLSMRDEVFTIPTALASFNDNGLSICDGRYPGDISAALTEDRCFLVLHDDIGLEPLVACIDRSTGKIVWKSSACGCWWGFTIGEFSDGWVSVVLKQDRVIVFGKATTGFYAHALHKDDGKTLFRFSSSF